VRAADRAGAGDLPLTGPPWRGGGVEDRGAHRAGAGRPPAHRPRRHKPGDRRRAVHQRGDGEDPHRTHPGEAGTPGPTRGDRVRLRPRPCGPWKGGGEDMTEAPEPGAAGTVQADTMLFNPFLPEMRTDPYPAYHLLRGADPVHLVPLEIGPQVWILSRYRDVAALLRNAHVSSD